MQQPTVLVRIFGTTRDKLLPLRQKKYGDGSYGPEESLAEVLDRLVTAALKPAPIARRKAKGRRHRARGKVKGKRKRQGKARR